MNNNETTSTTENDKGFGVALGLFTWGLLFLSFTKLVGLTGWTMWAMYGIGFLCTLMGAMGLCIEAPEYVKELVRLKYRL